MSASHGEGGYPLSVKILAIIGFCITVGLVVWAAFQGASRLPGAFSSLAQTAESLQTTKDKTRAEPSELTIATEKNVVNAKDSFTISWTDMKHPEGTYVFRFACIDGVRLTVRTEGESTREVRCTDALSLPGTAFGLFITVDTQQDRFTDVPPSLTFLNSEKKEIAHTGLTVTVVNALIPAHTSNEVQETAPSVTVTEESTPVVAPRYTSLLPQVPVRETTAPAYTTDPSIPTTPTIIPTDDGSERAGVANTPTQSTHDRAHGPADLRVAIVNVGTMEYGAFHPTGNFDEDLRAGVQFDVRNMGAQTSSPWTFSAVLPNGQNYTSSIQPALAPYSGVILTIGFDLGDDSEHVVPVAIAVTMRGDVNQSNNVSSKSVQIRD